MIKMLITGARGFLGVRVAQYYAGHYEVIAIGHEEMDISDLESVRRQFGQHRPDVVIHCAAISDTGYAERHPGESFAVNVLGSEHVARACAEVGGKLLYMSSDQIYNGNAESYIQNLLPHFQANLVRSAFMGGTSWRRKLVCGWLIRQRLGFG